MGRKGEDWVGLGFSGILSEVSDDLISRMMVEEGLFMPL
jgi:hypothetical protein